MNAPSLRHFLRGVLSSGLLATSIALAGCAGSDSASDSSVSSDEDADSLSGKIGCDYSFSRPSPTHLRNEGYHFVVRYFGRDPRKDLTKAEANSLKAAGLDIVSNWEDDETDALSGYDQGVKDARDADAQAKAAGAPAGRPIYFSVDFDASESEQGAIDNYMDGVASVIGRDRTGAYGGYYVMKRLFDAHKITWGWQTTAWSGGEWDPRLQIRQIENGLEGDSIDKDQAMVSDIGQWSASGGGGNPPPPASNCSVHSDKKLYCKNQSNAALYKSDKLSSQVVNHLRSTDSWFKCWGTGELHSGGNHTWYYTEGDDNASWGWAPASELDTTSAFDANPSAHGLPECTPPKPAPPKLPSDCDIHSDKKLYCADHAGSAMYSSPHDSAGVVNHLRTANSWFKCWGTGDLHSGGNHTWYYTEGDDNSKWGWVPAVDLKTPDTFDANPSAYDFPRCD